MTSVALPNVRRRSINPTDDPTHSISPCLTQRRCLMNSINQAAQTYWQVKRVGTPGATRVYPEAYRPRVVGMLWSTLAQMQTWFGAEAWKVYGIQVSLRLGTTMVLTLKFDVFSTRFHVSLMVSAIASPTYLCVLSWLGTTIIW